MDDLLEQLEALVAPRARRWVVLGLVVLTVVAAVVSVALYRQAEESAQDKLVAEKGERSALEREKQQRKLAEAQRDEAERPYRPMAP